MKILESETKSKIMLHEVCVFFFRTKSRYRLRVFFFEPEATEKKGKKNKRNKTLKKKIRNQKCSNNVLCLLLSKT